MGIVSTTQGEALAALILQAIAFPGYLFSIAFTDRIGLRNLQLIGFFLTTTFFLILAFGQASLVKIPALYLAIYGITFFFQNFGPNATTYIIPSVVFDIKHKATCHGISAAAGKLGAIVAAQSFVFLSGAFCTGGVCSSSSATADVNAGLQLTFGVCSGIGVLGWLWSYALVPASAVTSTDTSYDKLLNKDGLIQYEDADDCADNDQVQIFSTNSTTF